MSALYANGAEDSPSRLRILHVAPMPFPLAMGSQVYVGRLCQALARQGHDVTLACYPGQGDIDLTGVRVVTEKRIPGTFSHSGPHWSRPVQDILLARRLRGLKAVDVVHAHNVEGPMVTALARCNAPVVYGQHTAMAEELPQWIDAPGMQRVGRMVDALVPRLADASVGLSRAGLQTLPAGSGLAPPGIDLTDLHGADAMRARERWQLGEGPWVGYVGNADPYQEVERFIEAMAQVRGAKVLLVTSSDPEPFIRQAEALGVTHFHAVGHADFAAQKDALALLDVAVCPRRLCRGFPIKLLNQLGLGVPSVCAPGSARAIDGVVRTADDSIAGLAQAIQSLVDDRALRERLSRAAVRDVRARWTWEARAQDMERVYRSVLARRR